MTTSLRQQYQAITTQLKEQYRLLSLEFRTLSEIAPDDIEARKACSQRIGRIKSEQRKVQNACDTLLDVIFDLLERPDFTEKAEQAEAHLKTLVEADKANTEIKTQKVIRNVDNKLRQDAMAATLREVWSVNTFPIFQAILQMNNQATAEHAKYYAQLALHQYMILNRTLRSDESDNLDYPEPVWTGKGSPSLTIDDIENMSRKIIAKTEQRNEQYQSLCAANEPQTPTVIVERGKTVAVKMKKRRIIKDD